MTKEQIVRSPTYPKMSRHTYLPMVPAGEKKRQGGNITLKQGEKGKFNDLTFCEIDWQYT